MSTKSDISFLPPPNWPRMSIILAIFMAQVSNFFWENKSKFVVQKKKKIGRKKPKMIKIFGFEIWKRLKKANFEQFWGSPFFFMICSGFRGQFFFVIFVFFLKKLFLVSSSLRLLIKYFFYLKKVWHTCKFMSLYAINKTNRKPLNIPISSRLS